MIDWIDTTSYVSRDDKALRKALSVSEPKTEQGSGEILDSRPRVGMIKASISQVLNFLGIKKSINE